MFLTFSLRGIAATIAHRVTAVTPPHPCGLVVYLAILSYMEIFVPMLWIIFLVLVAFYAIYGIILIYHWVKWSHSTAMTTLAISIYSGVGILLGAVLLGVLLSLSL